MCLPVDPSQPIYLPGLMAVGMFPIPGQPITARPGSQQTAFAMTAGGALDIKIDEHLSFRTIGLY